MVDIRLGHDTGRPKNWAWGHLWAHLSGTETPTEVGMEMGQARHDSGTHQYTHGNWGSEQTKLVQATASTGVSQVTTLSSTQRPRLEPDYAS